MDARRATVQSVLASRCWSRSKSCEGERQAASTYGREVEAMLWSDCSRKLFKAESRLASWLCGPVSLWCARKDSRPELYAKDPRGSAESERRRRLWSDVVVVVVVVGGDSGEAISIYSNFLDYVVLGVKLEKIHVYRPSYGIP